MGRIKKRFFLLAFFLTGVILVAGVSHLLKQNGRKLENGEKNKIDFDVVVQETGEESPAEEEVGRDWKVAAYYPSWKEGEENLEKLRFDIITHVIYAFAIPTADGSLEPLEHSYLAEEIITRAHRENAQVLIGVGGWSFQGVPLERTFEQATDSPEKIRKLGDSILSLTEKYGFDGVDMDWEYPKAGEPSEAQYEALMLYLSGKLQEQGKLLTCAVVNGVTPEGEVYRDAAAQTDAVLNAVDWIHVMAYDGGEGEKHSSYEFAAAGALYWRDTRGVSPDKIVLGIPFYGRPNWMPYEELLQINQKAYETDVLNLAGTDIYYNGYQTIQKKVRFAKENLGGIMIWEITQDTGEREKSLLTAVGEALR